MMKEEMSYMTTVLAPNLEDKIKGGYRKEGYEKHKCVWGIFCGEKC